MTPAITPPGGFAPRRGTALRPAGLVIAVLLAGVAGYSLLFLLPRLIGG